MNNNKKGGVDYPNIQSCFSFGRIGYNNSIVWLAIDLCQYLVDKTGSLDEL